MKLRACECPPGYLERLRRPLLIRLAFPRRKLYRCLSCSERLLLPAETMASPPPWMKPRRSILARPVVVVLISVLGSLVFLGLFDRVPSDICERERRNDFGKLWCLFR